MNMINDQENEQRMIDRLVDGELPDSERLALFARLDADPLGWRRCALAFLEAQAWREALEPVAVIAAPRVEINESPKTYHLTRTKLVSGIAAGLLLAFSLGWFVKGRGPASHTIPTVVKAEIPTPESTPAPEPKRVVPKEPPRPDPVVAQLESRGYRVDRRERIVAVQTRDGRRVAVPVKEVRVEFVGDRTY